ncbi:MAG: RnfABCDGE type electron transport complex subunit D [Lentisphaeria bacterium]|nr:RnfABCDGE type electron transport complex subunit D [Candidatus Neomarinimicrobiota bacterium]MCF7841758.1 RnfABCDGE type electron transport complex subunit D [Lentisphaeria bacterium]
MSTQSPASSKGKSKLQEPENLLILASSPHLHTTTSTQSIMWQVVLALLPATAMAIYYFRWPAVVIILTSVITAVLTEAIINRLKGETPTITDGSAVITGLLLALTLPPTFSIGGTILGAVVAIGIGKQLFGGLGYNIFNPALLGRAFLQASFPIGMTTWSVPATLAGSAVDGLSGATPLGLYKFEHALTGYADLFVGNVGGSLGETSALAILIGGIYLLIRRFADWRIPVSYLGGVIVIGGIFWAFSPDQFPDPVFHLLSGGLMLGAFFMATDMVTSPITRLATWIYGIGMALILVIIRLFGGLPEGVMYSILLMNAVTPLLNRYTRPKIFGEVQS